MERSTAAPLGLEISLMLLKESSSLRVRGAEPFLSVILVGLGFLLLIYGGLFGF